MNFNFIIGLLRFKINYAISDETEEAAIKRRRRDELPNENDLVIRDVGYILNAQTVAAEIITNLCVVEDEGLSYI